jgi:3-phosphoshikimate 1-carboxyvinyltransferase
LEQTVRSPRALAGSLSVPGDKSISHRSLLLNAIAHGDARVTGLSRGEDVLSTMACLRALGVRIEDEGPQGPVTVHRVLRDRSRFTAKART